MITIAVIDDDQPLLDLMAEVLDERHWAMLAVPDVATAVEALKGARPDAILLDVRLHGRQRGWDVLEQLQAEPETRTIPVVIWSSDVHCLDDEWAWLADHRIPVLSKPFDLDEMYACLDRALDGHQMVTNERVIVSA
jgi:CheY-like chemotaxis protein